MRIHNDSDHEPLILSTQQSQQEREDPAFLSKHLFTHLTQQDLFKTIPDIILLAKASIQIKDLDVRKDQ